MRLLYITNGITGSAGLERVLSIKSSYLADEYQYEILILSLNEGVPKPFYDFSKKVAFRSIPVGGDPISYFKSYRNGIQETIDDFRPDIISICDDGLKAFFLPRIIKTQARMIYERHVSKNISLGNKTGVSLMLAKLQLKLMNLLAPAFDAFVVLTPGNLLEWDLKKARVINNPLSFYPEQTAGLRNKKVLAVGRQSYQKGYDLLLQAWQGVIAQHPDWQLEIFGKPDPRQQLPEMAKALHIGNNVSFFEAHRDIESKYLEASVYVMSSRFEGFGMVLIEAMACGVPCVSFDCPHGPSDIISNHVDGLLVKNGDVNALSQALLQLVGDESQRREMGNEARKNVERFLPSKIVAQWNELFKSLVK